MTEHAPDLGSLPASLLCRSVCPAPGQYLDNAREEVNTKLTRDMLATANIKCFRMCFKRDDASSPSPSSPSATSLTSSLTTVQTSCINHCLDKFLEARQLAF